MPNLRCRRKALSGLEDLLEIVGLEVMAEGVRTGAHSGSERDRVPRVAMPLSSFAHYEFFMT